MSLLFTNEECLNAADMDVNLDDNILFSKDEVDNAQPYNSDKVEPFSYYNTKTSIFQNLGSRALVESNMQSGISNAKLGLLMNEYNNKKANYEYKEKEKKRYLHPDQFDTIFNDQYTNEQVEREREKYYKQFIVNPRIQEQQEENEQVALISVVDQKGQRMIQYEMEQPDTHEAILKQKDMLNDFKREVRYINEQAQQLYKKSQINVPCKNLKLVKKLAPTIYNAYNAYFDDIFDALMNEILVEEALNLNEMEQRQTLNTENTDPNKSMRNQQQILQTPVNPLRQTRKLVADSQLPSSMIQLIGSLDEYCQEDDYY